MAGLLKNLIAHVFASSEYQHHLCVIPIPVLVAGQQHTSLLSSIHFPCTRILAVEYSTSLCLPRTPKMSITYYRTENGLPPNGGKPPAPTVIPNPNRRWITLTGDPPYGGWPPSQRPAPPPEPAPAFPAPEYRIIAPAPYPCHNYPGPLPDSRAPSPSPEPQGTFPAWEPPPRYQSLPAPRFSPPGYQLNGHTPSFFGPAADFNYIFPSAHIRLKYWDDGTQPWLPNGNGSSRVSTLVVPACMRVKDLIVRLGAPTGRDRRYGITATGLIVVGPRGEWEMFGDVEEGIKVMGLGRPGYEGRWVRGRTWTLSDEGDPTLEEAGWEGCVGVAVSVW